ncbi:TadE/TadG family type IV pilus assembly protein [uncultured Sulfitobacter sp.]|uniref:TadE/TadG family type IV pilus assembly protein n=1 Tax=uncultured Sulfitobacter sp. TaxID=191468 RepID=UPI00261B3294|nr:TadE/TadG family type IV pilus assembly protein [uncultured Sulfitobacter sp.]
MSKLFPTTRIPDSAGRIKTPFLRRFAREEDGMITIIAICVLLMMFMVGGIAVDLMRNEMERVRIQNTADRAVLAAADLDQELVPAEVVADYFTKAGIPDRINNVTVDEGLNFRTVSVNSDSVTPTNFMRLVGVDELPLRSKATAEERVTNVEISMVLDISGSMGSGDKMPNLQQAAKVFVDTVLRPETQDLVSISLIPYSEHVSAGQNLMSKFNVDYDQSYSYCLEFSESDFDVARMRRDKTYRQVPHFQWGYNGYHNDVSNPVCPNGTYESITAFSQNATALKYQINRLQARGSTSIFAGMKWATGMLDPDFNTITQSLVNDDEVDAIFANRPESYTDRETLKTIILMTDGENHYSYRIADQYYANYSHASHWNRYNLNWYLANYVNRYYHDDFKYMKYWPSYGNQLLHSVCDAAKEKNIVIWSIGFEVEENGANVMKNCASSPSHFFRVEGVEITEAFRAIARQINQLRLTQ